MSHQPHDLETREDSAGGALPSPIVVGGVGGSGTRVVAKLLIDLGIDMGQHFSPALDNVWFTFLFKRHAHFRAFSKGESKRVDASLELIERLMTGRSARYPDGLLQLGAAFVDVVRRGQSVRGQSRGRAAARRLWGMLALRPDSSRRAASWGWKEPNSHVFADRILEHFPRARYIHVVRDGLDMAFSGNTMQLQNWGPGFGVELPARPELVPGAQLKLWLRANLRAAELRERFGPKRFLWLRYEDLCLDSGPTLDVLCQFLSLDPPRGQQRSQLLSDIQQPEGIGRHREHDLSLLDDADVRAARRFQAEFK